MRPLHSILLLVAALALLAPAFANGLASGLAPVEVGERDVLFTSTFGSLRGWDVDGALVTTACDALGACHLHMLPACCDVYSTANRVVALESDTFTVTVRFRAESLQGPADSALELDAANGKNLVLITTEGQDFDNNGVRLVYGDTVVGIGLFDTGTFAVLPAAGAWYELTLAIDSDASTAVATVHDAATGEFLGSSGDIPVGDFDSIAIARLRASAYGIATSAFHWDSLTITT